MRILLIGATGKVGQDTRWISLGGAGSLEVEPGVQFVDTPGFPAVARPESDSFRNARTGTYRIGTDTLLRRADGSSAISAADQAVAVADEAERAGTSAPGSPWGTDPSVMT